jgi:hypothetical protein
VEWVQVTRQKPTNKNLAADRVRGDWGDGLSTEANPRHGLNDAITKLQLKLAALMKLGEPLVP